MNDRPARPPRLARQHYRRFVPLSTRWADNDVYGHVNNVAYYAFFDTAVNQLLIEAGLLDPGGSDRVGMVVESRCTYFASLTYPEPIEVGVRVDQTGRSSVRYGLGVFGRGLAEAAAQGEFTHVYVDRATQRPVPIWPELLAHFDGLRTLIPAPSRPG